VASGPGCRQRVVRSRYVIAEGDRGVASHEERAVRTEPPDEPLGRCTCRLRCSGATSSDAAQASLTLATLSAASRATDAAAAARFGDPSGSDASCRRRCRRTCPIMPGARTAKSQRRASGSCSAWASRSAATTSASAVRSAITASSDGPATKSMPTRFASCTLASDTKRLPGPTMRSTAFTGPAPNASAAMAWAPPIANTRSTLARLAAARMAGCTVPSRRGGVASTTSRHPATRAGTAPSGPTSTGDGARPARRRRPVRPAAGAARGRCRVPPGGPAAGIAVARVRTSRSGARPPAGRHA